MLSLSKRKRRTSASISTEERRTTITSVQQSPPRQTPLPIQKPAQITQTPKELKIKDDGMEKENKDMNKQELIMLVNGNDNATSTTASSAVQFLHHHREKKRMKKRKRDKLKEKLLHDDISKKRKKKHKCLEEFCKHKRHHKKHRKHKKHHHQHEKNEIVEQPKKIETDIKIGDTNNENIQLQTDIYQETLECDEENEKKKQCKIIDAVNEDEEEEYQIETANIDNQVTLDDIMEAKSKVINSLLLTDFNLFKIKFTIYRNLRRYVIDRNPAKVEVK